jgi:PAS domain S-box-containing protein
MRIKNRLFIIIVSIITTVVILSAFISLTLYKKKILSLEKRNFYTLLRVFAYSCKLDIDKFIEALGDDSAVLYSMVLSSEGDVLVHSEHELEGTTLTDPVSMSAIRSNIPRFVDIEWKGEKGIDASMPISLEDVKWAIVRIGFSVQHIEDDIEDAKLFIFTLAFITIFFGAVIAYIFSKMIVKPIEDLTEKAEQIAKGNRNVEFAPFTGKKDMTNEVNRLIETFKIMYGSIMQKENELIKDEMHITRVNIELQDALQKLTDSEAKYKTLTESARDVIFTVNLRGRFTFLNEKAKEILDLEDNESLIGRSFTNILTRESRHTAFDTFKKIRAGEETKAFEVTAIKGDEGSVSLGLILSPIMEEGLLVGIHGIARDISYRKSLEAQLVQSGKLSSIGELATGIAHELNQPLMIIRGYAQLLSSDLKESDKYFKELELMEKHTGRMAKIISHLQAFARQDVPDFTYVNLNDIIDSALFMVTEHLKLKNITVVKQYNEDLPHIYGDYNQLEQVLLNIITNARDAMEEMDGGKLMFTTDISDDKKFVTVSVSDEGSGIPEDRVKDIFNPFFTTKVVGKGTGLGLSISYGIIQSHNGMIDVDSRPGEGTTFKISLPMFEEGHE